jgi:opacity protein-like surface antigen
MQNRPFGVIFIILCFFTVTLQGQKKVNSPYSRFNIGGLNVSGPFRSIGMGGTGVAMRDGNSLYFYNPASYTSIDTVSFIFDFGADLSRAGLDDGTSKFYSTDLNFNHLLMGFPVSRKFGFAVGILPVSNGYYYLSEVIKSGDPNYDPNTGEVTYIHKGSGSLSNLFVGTGFKLTKKLSLGVNMSVIFGELTRLNQFEFADYANTFNQNAKENLRINGVHFDYGLQYYTKIKKDYFFTAGLSYTAPGRFASSLEKVATRFTAYSSAPIDTLPGSYSYSHSRDSTKFPGSYKAGLSFGKTDKLTVELDYVFTNWSKALIHGDNSTLANTSSLMLGLEYIPDKYSNTSFLKRIEYRLGGHIADNYLILNGVQLKEYGASMGLGFRLKGTQSKVNIFFDYTRKEGDISKGMYNENIFSAGISLNLYDNWFLKRKYD